MAEQKTITWLYGAWVAGGLLLGLALVALLGYEGSFLWANRHHAPWADVLFRHLTNLGDAQITLGLVGLVVARRYPAALLLAALAAAVAGLLGQLLKRAVFYEWERPLAVLGEAAVHWVGPERLYRHSFPSGHATASLAMATALALTLPLQRWGVTLVAWLGLLAAYSRVYIGAHFLGDVVAGAALGALVAFGLARAWGQRWQRFFESRSPATRRWVGWGLSALAFAVLIKGLLARYPGLVG